MSPETFAALVGAGVGALASGVISIALQIQGQRRTDRKERADSKATDRAALEAVFMATQTCASTASHIAQYVAHARTEAGEKRDLWQTLLAFANLPPSVDLGPKDLGVLLKHGKTGLFNDVRDAISAHNASIQAWQAYALVRAEFGRSVPARMDGSRGVTEMDSEQQLRVGPLVAELSTIAAAIEARAANDAAFARETVERVVVALNEIAGIRLQMSWETRDGMRAE